MNLRPSQLPYRRAVVVVQEPWGLETTCHLQYLECYGVSWSALLRLRMSSRYSFAVSVKQFRDMIAGCRCE